MMTEPIEKKTNYCQQCNKSFQKTSSYKIHMGKHAGKRHTCDICDKSYTAAYSLTIHKRIHSDDKPYKCQHCKSRFFKSGDCLRHEKKCNSKGENASKCKRKLNTKTMKPVIVCRICKHVFSCMSSYYVHEKKHKGIRHYCTRCAKSFTTQAELKTHEKNHDLVTKYSCNHCEKVFRRKSNLARHKHLHEGKHRYMCHVCGKSFILHEGYSAHMKVHQSYPSAWCNICGAAFKSISSLKAHQKMHTNKKDFKCEICDRDFLRKRTLEDHMKVHTKGTSRKALISTPVEFCALCSKGFSDNYGLQRHMRKHRLGLLKRYNRIQTKNVELSQNVSPVNDRCRSRSDRVAVQADDSSDEGPRYQSIDPECFMDKVNIDNGDVDDANVSSDENVEEAVNDIECNEDINIENTSGKLNKSNDKDISEDHFIDYNKETPIDKLKEIYAAEDVTEEDAAVINSVMPTTEYITENSSIVNETHTHSPNEPVQPVTHVSENNEELESEGYENRIVQITNPSDIHQCPVSDGVFDSIQSTASYGESFLLTNIERISGFRDSVETTNDELTCTTETINIGLPNNELTADVIDVITQPISVEIQQNVPVNECSDSSIHSNHHLHNNFRLFPSSSFSDQEKIDYQFDKRKITGNNVDEENVDLSEACSSDITATVNTISNKNVISNHSNEEVKQSTVCTQVVCRTIGCRKCSKTFSDQLSYNSHLVDHEEQQFECHFCMSKYANHKSLKMHLYRYHPNGERNIYKCDTCSKMFASKLIYLNHVDNHRWKGKKLEKEKSCDVCDTMFKSNLSYYRHMRVKHNIYKELDEDKQDNDAKAESPKRSELIESNTNDVNHSVNEINADENNEEINKTTDFDGKSMDTCNETRNSPEFKLTFNAVNNENKLTGDLSKLSAGENASFERKYEANSIVCSDPSESESNVNVLRNITGNKSQNKKASAKFQRKYKCTKCDKSFYMKASRKQHMLTHSKCNEGLGDSSNTMNAGVDTQANNTSEPNMNPIEGKLSNLVEDGAVHCDYETSEIGLNECTNITVIIEDREEITDQLNDDQAEVHSNEKDKDTICEHEADEQIGIKIGDKDENSNTGLESENINTGSSNEENKKCKKEKLSTLFKCLQCKKEFSTKSEKVQHVKKVHDANQYLCENCPKKFSTLHNLKRHIEINHSNDDGKVTKNFMCTECGKCFTASDSLRIHMFSHTGERPYKCEHCDASYIQSGHLTRHVRTAHVRQSVYKCQHPGCQKKFYDPSSLTIHMKIHSDVRQYQCAMCPKVFKTSVVLKKHIKTHQDTKDFECHICSQMLSTNFCLQKHLKRHTSSEKMDPCSTNYDPNFSSKVKQRCVKKMEEKKFQCEFCVSKFTTTRALLAHQRKFCKGKVASNDSLSFSIMS